MAFVSIQEPLVWPSFELPLDPCFIHPEAYFKWVCSFGANEFASLQAALQMLSDFLNLEVTPEALPHPSLAPLRIHQSTQTEPWLILYRPVHLLLTQRLLLIQLTRKTYSFAKFSKKMGVRPTLARLFALDAVKPKSRPKKPAKKPVRRLRRAKKSCEQRKNQLVFDRTSFPPLSLPQLHTDICELVNEVDSKLSLKSPVVYQMLGYLGAVIESLFPGSSVCLYGSFAAGIALTSSDVDMQIYNLDYAYTEAIQLGCSHLHQYFNQCAWITKSECILTATIPLVKIEVDLSAFGQVQECIQVDISFSNALEGWAHSAIYSLNVTRSALMSYPPLKYLVLTVKQLLQKNGLNSAFSGGLNSYSVVLWSVALIKQLKTVPEDYGELLIAFLEYFGNKFDYLRMGIDVKKEKPFFKKAPVAEVVTIDPVIYTNNTTKSVFNIESVLLLFRNSYKSLLNKKVLSQII